MRFSVGAATDIGRVREGNEDAFVADDPLYAVADGMGGHRGGEVASALALETLEVLVKHRRGTLAEQVREANRAVWERSAHDASVAGMGTTLTAVVVDDGGVRLVHVGDSRAYLLREGELRLLTEDHTLVQEMVDRGEITAAESRTHPQRSVLVRALGTEPDVRVDEGIVELREGDRLLLCSDGLNGMIPDTRIAEILGGEPDPQAAADLLVRDANQAGGIDNVTVIVLDAVAEEAGAVAAPAAAGTAGTTSGDAGAGEAGKERGRGRRPRDRAAGTGSARWVRPVVWVVVVVAVIGGALVGARAYLNDQWYVGVSGERVAVFRGVPSDVLGFKLHSTVLVTRLPADQVQRITFYRDLREGITADSREQADQIVAQMEQDLLAATSGGERSPGTVGGMGGGGGGDGGGGGGGG